MIKILIADDHSVVRQGLKKILSEESDMTVQGEAENADELLALIREKEWDVVVLDISMPGRSGLDVLRDIHQIRPKLPVLFLSMLPEEQYAVRAFKAGAAGYTPKGTKPEELIRAIRKIYRGGKYISPVVAENLANAVTAKIDKPPHELLSSREFEVMRKIAEGKTITGIAKELHLSVKTITTYRARVLAKMQMHSNAELARYAVENKLIE